MKELKQMERLIDLQAEMIKQLLRELNKKTNPPIIYEELLRNENI